MRSNIRATRPSARLVITGLVALLHIPVAPARAQGDTSAAAPATRAATRAATPAATPAAAVPAAPGATRAIVPAPTLTLGALERAIERRNPRVAAVRAAARAADARVPAAGLPPDPQLQLGWMNYALPSLAPMEPLGMTQLQVMQMLPLGGKLRATKRAAQATADAAGARAGEALLEARARAAMAFFDLAAADRSLAIMRESVRLLADIERTVSSMYRVGESRQADVLRAQVELARMGEDTLRMQAMRTAMAGTLAALVDAPIDSALGTPVMPAFPRGAPSLDSLLALAESRRPMLRAMASELAAAGARATLARKELVPDLTIGVQYGQRRAAADAMDGSVGGGGTERMGSLMLGASLPVFARLRQLPMRQEMEAMQAMARADLADARAGTRRGLVEALATLERARRLRVLYEGTILPQAEAAVASSLAAYRVGQVDFMTLLDNRMAANRFRTELASLAADEGKAWAELEMLTATALMPRDGGDR